MAARKQRSKRRSATTSLPEETVVFFVDRSLGKGVRDALREAGANVVYLEDDHDDDASDEEWLTFAGRNDYVVVTKDKQIRLRLAERDALVAANVRAFFLTSGNLTGAEMSTILTAQLTTMTRVARETPRPFVATVSKTDVVVLASVNRRSQ